MSIRPEALNMSIRPEALKEITRSRYGARARAIMTEEDAGRCCEADCCGDRPLGVNAFSEGLYAVEELDGLPLRAALATLGCANPIALAELEEGEVVLDLGSGGGLDVILSARRVGTSGHAYGLDMTDEMLSLAWQNAAEAGVENATFLKGDIEQIPMPNGCVDVIISNCVINLALDKDQVIHEMWRVLRPGGRIAITDVVVMDDLPDLPVTQELRRDVVAWGSCLAGALSFHEYRSKLEKGGFARIELEVVRRHTTQELLPRGLPEWAQKVDRAVLDGLMSHFTSSFVRAHKPD